MTEFITAETPGQPGAPLIVTFHGTGGDEHQLHALARQLRPGAHVLSPRGPVREGAMARFFRRTGEGVYDMADLALRVADMAGFVTEARARIGADRVVALGYSNGANIAAAVSFAHPAAFDALALMHPLIPWSPGPQPGLAGRRVLITAGRRDPICPEAQTRALADWYQAQGAATDLHWHPGGHEIAPGELTEAAHFLAG